jgi:methyl-accepting chemotaxis protein
VRLLSNLRLLTKLAIPSAILVVVTVGLVFLAGRGLESLTLELQNVIDGPAARRSAALQLHAAINEATIHEKNMILEDKDQEAIRTYEVRYKEAKDAGMAAADELMARAGTPELRQKTDEIRRTVAEYFAIMDKSVAFALQHDDEAAFKISGGDGRKARVKTRSMIDERTKVMARELAEASESASELANATSRTIITSAAVGLLLAIGILGAITVFGVVRPLTAMTAAMARLAGGDLEVEVRGIEQKDEVGQLARALQSFKDNAVEARRLAAAQEAENQAKMRRAQNLDELTRRFEAEVSARTQGLSSAATEMEATAQSMTAIAAQTNTQSMTVASAAEQASANVQTVAAAAEELSVSIQEIASQVAQSSRVAERAVDGANRTNTTVRMLAESAERIGQVIALINTIAGQTNLLALNATIEAARAGEAGRGFAVVANEVKELANQTAKATDEIGSQIASVQQATQECVNAIQHIAATISEMSQISNSIAAAVEEQGAATKEIARNVQEAARGTEQVTSNITDVREGAGQTGSAASQVLSAAQELARHSSDLSSEVDTFLAGVKAA